MPVLVRLTGARRAEVLQQDAAVVRAAANPSDDPEKFQRLLKTFRESPITGMTTMLDFARNKSRFRPFVSTEIKQLYEFMQLLPPPLWGYLQEPGMQFDVTVGDGIGGTNVEQIIAKYAGNDAEIAGLIQNQIRNTMKAALENPGQAQSATLLFEHSIDAGEKFVYRAIRSEITFTIALLPGMKYLMNSKGQKGGFAWTFDPREWPSRAEEVLKRHLSTLDEWFKGARKAALAEERSGGVTSSGVTG